MGTPYRIEDLAHVSGASVRTIRAYQDRGLLPRPERSGRANLYSDAHLARLRQIAELLDRGYTLASIKELLEAWDAGRGLGGVLGLVAEIDRPWTDEEAVRISRADLDERFGGSPDDAAVAEAVELGVLEPVPGDAGSFLVPSPQELAVAVELHAAGVPLSAISAHLRELRVQVEHIAARFLEFTTEHVFARYLDGPHRPTDADAAEAASLVRRLRPLAQHTVDAELARAMRALAVRQLREQLGEDGPETTRRTSRSVSLPEETMRAVEALVGERGAAEFVALAAEREVRARALDALTSRDGPPDDLDERGLRVRKLSTDRPTSLWITTVGCGSNLRGKNILRDPRLSRHAERMDERRTVKVSKYLSKHLRHQPERIGLTLDEAGWVEIDVLMAAAAAHGFRFTREELDHVVAENDKKRFAIDGTRIRASQGHSVEVDLGLPPATPPAYLYHGTVARSLDAIRAEGLRPMNRHDVHLSPDRETATRVGARRGRPVILSVDAGAMHRDGHVFHVSANGVWLTQAVPPRYLRFPEAH